jgi:hypothetical protein
MQSERVVGLGAQQPQLKQLVDHATELKPRTHHLGRVLVLGVERQAR